MMADRLMQMRQLAALIQAECEGLVIDRAHARALAQTIAQRNPDISGTMRLLCERLTAAEARD